MNLDYKLLTPIKGDASNRKFYRKKKGNKSSIIIFCKKEKYKNLIIYESINRVLIKNKISAPKYISQNLKKDFIDAGLVKFEHHPFPLDLAALNAEIILRCGIIDEKKFELLGTIYKKQNSWAVGSDINRINESIKKIGTEFNMKEEKMNNCLKNDKSQDEILNQRIEAQKKYKIQSTPTIFINEKKYSGEVNYKKFKKAIEKNL